MKKGLPATTAKISPPRKRKKETANSFPCTHCLSYSPNWDTPSTIAYHSKLHYLAYAANNSIFVANLLTQSPVIQLVDSPKNRIRALTFLKEYLIAAKKSTVLDFYKVDPFTGAIEEMHNSLELKEIPDTLMYCDKHIALCSTIGNSLYGIKAETSGLEISFSITIGLIIRYTAPIGGNYTAIAGASEVWIFDFVEGKKVFQVSHKNQSVGYIQSLSCFEYKDNYCICATDKSLQLHIWELSLPEISILNYFKLDLGNSVQKTKDIKAIIQNECTVAQCFNLIDSISIVYGIEYGSLKKLQLPKTSKLTQELLESELKKNTLLVDSPHRSNIFWLQSAFIENTMMAVSVSFEGVIAVWNLETESKEWHLSCARSVVRAIAKTAPSKILLGLHGNMKLWNLGTKNRYQVLDEYKDIAGDVVRIFPLEIDESLVGHIERNEKKETFCSVYHIYEETKIHRLKIKAGSIIYSGWHLSIPTETFSKGKTEEEEEAKVSRYEEIMKDLIARHKALPYYILLTGSSRLLACSVFRTKPHYTVQLEVPLPPQMTSSKGAVNEATAGAVIEISGILGLSSALLIITGYQNGYIAFWVVIDSAQYRILLLQSFVSKIEHVVSNCGKIGNKDELFEKENQIAVVVEGSVVYIFSLTKMLLQLHLISLNRGEFAEQLKLQKWKDFISILDTLKGHEKPITCVNYVHNSSKHLLTGSQDKSVQLWDCSETNKGARAVCNIRGHSGYISAVYGYFEDSRLICITAGEDQTCKVWDIDQLMKEGEAVPKRPPKEKVKKGKTEKTVQTLFPRIQQKILTQQTNEDCKATIELLNKPPSIPLNYADVCQNLDYYIHLSPSLRLDTRKTLAKHFIKYELDQYKYFEKFEYLHRFLVLSLWLMIASKDYSNATETLSTVYDNYHLIKDKTEHTDTVSFFYVSLIMSLKEPKQLSDFVAKMGEKKFDLHTIKVIELVNNKPLEDVVESYIEHDLLLDAMIICLLYDEGKEMVKRVMGIIKSKVGSAKPVQAQKLEAALKLIV